MPSEREMFEALRRRVEEIVRRAASARIGRTYVTFSVVEYDADGLASGYTEYYPRIEDVIRKEGEHAL